MKKTRPHFGIEKTVCCMAVSLGMAWASRGEEAKTSQPSALAELKAERARLGTILEHSERIKTLRVEAARAGDETERKGVIAQLHDTIPYRQQDAAIMAKDIGGMDMIRGLAGLLGSTNEWRLPERVLPPTGEKPPSCQMFLPPRILAAMMLSQMVGKPPAELKEKDWKFYTDAEVEIWKKWWEENKAKYEDKGK